MENSSAEDAKDLFDNTSNEAKDASKEEDQKTAPVKKRTRKRIKVEAPTEENKGEIAAKPMETTADAKSDGEVLPENKKTNEPEDTQGSNEKKIEDKPTKEARHTRKDDKKPIIKTDPKIKKTMTTKAIMI